MSKGIDNLKVHRYSEDEVIKAIIRNIPKDEEGIVEIYEINFKTRERRLCKKIIIVNELFLSKKEHEIAIF